MNTFITFLCLMFIVGIFFVLILFLFDLMGMVVDLLMVAGLWIISKLKGNCDGI